MKNLEKQNKSKQEYDVWEEGTYHRKKSAKNNQKNNKYLHETHTFK